ncbi:MAG: pyridoxal-dependent decarboxylase [Candidatus Eisenbacteria bacterium]
MTERVTENSAHFIDPAGSNRDAMRSLGYRFVDLLVDVASNSLARPAFDRDAAPEPGPYHPSEEGRPVAELMDELGPILSASLNPAHPGYMGHMDTLASAVGIFSDALVSAANNNMLSWEMSPVFTAMERQMTSWFTGLFGWERSETLPSGGEIPQDQAVPFGQLVSGGTLANMTAMLVARNALGGDTKQDGLARLDAPPVFLATKNAHFSFAKAANLLGLGKEGWVGLPTDEHGAVRIDSIGPALERVRREGRRPFALVGVAGTTVTGTIDPLPELADIAEREGLWFHVDAALGGAIAVSDRLRPRLAGAERARSITFNPQKWLFVPKTCASILFRDGRDVDTHLREAFVYGTSHRREHGSHYNLGEWTLQGTRRVDVLKLYLTLEHIGRTRLARIIERHLDLAAYLAERIDGHDELELLTRPDLNIVNFRYRGPSPWDDCEKVALRCDRITASIQRSVEDSGLGWLSLPEYRGRRYLRAVILHPDTDERRLDAILDEVVRAGREALRTV